MTFRQQFLEDLWLSLYGGLPEKGFYVDVGAADPVEGSMTAWLRERGGWEGLAIDGSPTWEPKWPGVAGAKFLVEVVGAKNWEHTKFKVNRANPWESRIADDGEPTAKRTLQSIFDEFSVERIDFLSLDVEGHEFDALRGFDLARYWPTVIVSEYRTRMGEGQRDAEDYRVRDSLLETGRYELINQTQANLIFKLKP